MSSERIQFRDGEARLPVQPDPPPDAQLFVLDIYSYESSTHPEFHLGWWGWPLDVARDAEEIRLVYRSPEQVEAYLVCRGEELAPQEQWFNPEYRVAPLQQVALIWYDAQGRIGAVQASLVMAVTDEALLQAYYANNAGRYNLWTPFLKAFHQRRLDTLGRLYRRYIPPGSRVLDIGSGWSLFYQTGGERWPYHITCFDLDRAAMKRFAIDIPSYTWMAASMQHLPFADASFDAIYAGETIEHAADVDATMADWVRVLRPGGTLIVTTPNRDRLLNRLNHTALPVSPEHLFEFSCGELAALFERSGCEVLRREGIYLELLSLWRQRRPYVDPLIGPEPLPRHLLALKPLLLLARPLPWLAWNMIFVGRRKR